MKYPLLTIAADGSAPSRRRYRPQKSRSFQCTLLRCLSWPAYKSGTGKSYNAALRPIFLDYCGTESEHRAFTANLRCGRAAQLGDSNSSIELLKSEPYLYAPPVRCEAGVRQIVYLPELFDLECKSQRDDVWLCIMPPTALLSTVSSEELACARAALRLTNDRIAAERQKVEEENAARESWRRHDLPKPLDLDDDAVRYWALVARELCVRLDARTRYPIPFAPEFRTLLVQHFIMSGAAKMGANNPIASLSMQRRERHNVELRLDGPDGGTWPRKVDDVGYLPPLALAIVQDELGTVLAQLAQLYYKREMA